jgi:hypothetical protein
MTGLTTTIFERISDPDTRHARVRTDEEVAAEFPEPKRAARLVHEHKGQRFRPHGTDSVGVILSHPNSRRSVQFIYRHDPDTVHSMPGHEFNDRFARLMPPRRRPTRGKRAEVRHIRPVPAGIINAVRGVAA